LWLTRTVAALRFTSDQYVYITSCSLIPVIKKNSNHSRSSSTFRVAFRLALYDDEVGLDSTVRRQNDGAIPQPFGGLNSFGEVDFLGLGVGHR
jgi:hypothetical protein